MLTIQLFGAPQLAFDGQQVDVTRRKSRALLYYLASQTTPLVRDQLLAFFWPDLERAAAQTALRSTLHGLRKACGPALLATDNTISLAADTVVDVREFERGLASPPSDPQRLAALLELYRGEFLAGFTLPDVEAFEHWMTTERERLRRLALRGFAQLAQAYSDQGAYANALDAIERAVALDPLQESLHRTAMRLLYLAGDRAGAIRRFEQLRNMLDEELGVPPLAETQALYDAIITETVEPTPVVAPPPATPAPKPPPAVAPGQSQKLPFVGRSNELALLHSLAEPRRLLLIEGESGIGKSRLADSFLQQSGRLVLAGAGRELEQALPYQPIIEALRCLLATELWPSLRAKLQLPAIWLAEVARLIPELALPQSDGLSPLRSQLHELPDAAESRLWEGINQFLRTLAEQQPLALFIDDLQWADASTLALLGYLARQTHDAPLILLATTHPPKPRTPLAALTQTLAHGDHLARITLKPLENRDITDLAQILSPTFTYPLADWLERNSEGNPYILAELVRHAYSHHLLQPDGTLNLSALSNVSTVPSNVYTLTQARLAELSESAHRLLDAAVVMGREFDFAVAAQAAGLDEETAIDALDELHDHGFVMQHNNEAPRDSVMNRRYRFDHPLTIEVASREIGEPRLRLLHRRVAEAIKEQYRQHIDELAGLLASHYAQGGHPEQAADYAFRAGGRAAALGAWAEAASFFRQALAGTSQHHPEGPAGARRFEILMALGSVQLNAGDAEAASNAFTAALELAKARNEQDNIDLARRELARSYISLNRFAQVIELAKQIRANPAFEVDAEILWGTALSLEGADLAEATAHLNRAAASCTVHADPTNLAHITFELGGIAAQQGDLPQAITHYYNALAVAEQSDAALTYRILAHNNLAYHKLLLGHHDALLHANLGLQIAQEHGALAMQVYLFSTMGEISLANGELDQAEHLFQTGLTLAEQLNIPERIAGLMANLGLVAQQRKQFDQARNLLSHALTEAERISARHLAAQIRIWLAPLHPPEEAQAHLNSARTFAVAGNRRHLLTQIAQIEQQLSATAKP